VKQVIRKGIREIVVDEVPDPVASPHHVLIQPFYSLISSGTETASIHAEGILHTVAENPSHLQKLWDISLKLGPLRTLREAHAKLSEYAALGYSGAGVIVDKHRSVADLSVGERVAYGGEGTGHAECVLAGEKLTARIPDGVSFRHASFATLGSIALNAVRIANVGLGERVAVIGLGLVGSLVVQLARLQGGVVIGLDLRDDRIELARQLGADCGVQVDPAAAQKVRELTAGRGADCVVIAASSKSDAPCRLALELCRERGRIVIVGAVDVAFPWNEMYLKEIQVLMARAYGPGCYDSAYEKGGQDYPLPHVRWTAKRNMEEFLRLVSAGQVQLDPLITHEFDLEEAPRAYETIMNPAVKSLAVVLRHPAASLPEPAAAFAPRRRVPVTTETSRTALRVGVVGAGNLTRWEHLPILKQMSGVQLQSIHSASGVRAKSYAQRFGAAYCCTDYDEILSDPAIDMVLIASRNPSHAPQALAALRAGKHVFVEKPMALTETECCELNRVVDESGKQLTVGFNRRFAPFYRALKDQLKRRTGPAVVNCRINSPGISQGYWMADPEMGGAVLGEACHFVDLMYWLLESEPLRVFAFSLPTDRKEPIGENNVQANFAFADGSIGHLTYCTIGSKTSGGERVEVFAEGLGASTEDFKRLSVATSVLRTRSRWFPDKGYGEQLRAFVEAIRSGRPPAVTVLDGARATLGCLRILESARQSAPCELNLAAIKS